MNIQNHFDISRFWLLLKLELLRSRKAILITFNIILGMMLLGIWLEPLVDDNKIIHGENYGFGLMIGGFVLSSLAFTDLGNSLRKHQYLTLPASTLEKLLCMWLLTCVGWVVSFTLFYLVYAPVGDTIGHMLYSNITYHKFDLQSDLVISIIAYYVVLQGIFLIGAVHFKGYVFPKTLFTLLLFGAVCGTIMYFIAGDLFNLNIECTTDVVFLENSSVYWAWLIIQHVFWWLLAPLCWIIAYFGLKEKEV